MLYKVQTEDKLLPDLTRLLFLPHRVCFYRSYAAASGQRLASTSQPLHRFQKVTTKANASQMVSSQCFQLMCVYVPRLLSVSVNLTLKTINLQTVRHHELPDCYDFHIMVGDGVFGSCSAVVILLLTCSFICFVCRSCLITVHTAGR